MLADVSAAGTDGIVCEVGAVAPDDEPILNAQDLAY
jgi:hypothetical protein